MLGEETINSLPNELIALVAWNLDLKTHSELSFTSNRFHSVLGSNSVWEHHLKQDFSITSSELKAYQGWLKELYKLKFQELRNDIKLISALVIFIQKKNFRFALPEGLDELNNQAQSWASSSSVSEMIAFRKKARTIFSSSTIKNNNRDTPLHQAVLNSEYKLCKFLIEAGADLEAVDHENNTVLLLAASSEKNEVLLVEMLIENKANLDHKDMLGYPSILYAACNGHKDICQKLMDAGARLDWIDQNNRGIADYARERGMNETAKIIDAHKEAKKMICSV